MADQIPDDAKLEAALSAVMDKKGHTTLPTIQHVDRRPIDPSLYPNQKGPRNPNETHVIRQAKVTYPELIQSTGNANQSFKPLDAQGLADVTNQSDLPTSISTVPAAPKPIAARNGGK